MASFKFIRLFTTIRDALRFTRPNSDVTESEFLSLKIYNSDFGVVIIEAAKNEVGRFVKKAALESFASTSDHVFFASSLDLTEEMISKFKLIRTKTMKIVDDSESLKDLKIGNKEEFLITACRSRVKDSLEGLNLAGPTKLQILEKTAGVKKTASLSPFNINQLLLEDDMRKVFVTLAQESAQVLATTSFGDKLISYYRQRIHNFIKHHSNAVKVMMQLGFPLDRVEFAMKLKAKNHKAALDWLIDNESPSDDLSEDLQSPNQTPRTSIVTSARRDSILSARFEVATSLQERILGLLEIVKFYAEKDELVYQENITEMVFMGYDVDQSRDTLRITRNNVAAAIASIHGDDNPSITELRDGFSMSSTVRQKILNSSQIQQSLGNPQSFHFFINILDNPTQANSWNPFTDIGSLMTHIIITYHEEKHICATNQFNESKLPISALSAPK